MTARCSFKLSARNGAKSEGKEDVADICRIVRMQALSGHEGLAMCRAKRASKLTLLCCATYMYGWALGAAQPIEKGRNSLEAAISFAPRLQRRK
jgi:hypothetical protein